MSTAAQINESTALEVAERKPMARVTGQIEFTRDQVELIKRTVARGATDDELALFLHQAKKTGLDPLAKQIYAIKRYDANLGREVMTIQTGIDGFRVTADRTEKLAGIDDAVYDREDADHPNKATVTVHKIVDGIPRPFTATARWNEYKQTKKDGTLTSFWKRMPYAQLAKCAEALALRKAFPADLSGVYTFEEMSQADNGSDEPEPPQRTRTPDVVKCADCKKPVTDYGLDGGKTMPADDVLKFARKKYNADLCGNCLVKRRDSNGKPAATTVEGESFVATKFEKDQDGSVIATGLVRSCSVTEGPKPRLIVKFDDDAEVYSWHTGDTRRLIEKHCLNKTCSFLCTDSKFGLAFSNVMTIDGQDADAVQLAGEIVP